MWEAGFPRARILGRTIRWNSGAKGFSGIVLVAKRAYDVRR